MSEPTGLQEKMLALAAQRDYFEQAKAYAYAYLDGVFDRNVYPDPAALNNLKSFDEALPENPGDPSEILRMLHEYGSPATVTTTGGRYFGLVVGGVFPPVMAVKWLADVWDQMAVLYVTSPLTAKLEDVCQQWLIELLSLPPECVAGFVSGTSMATMCGLAAGRYELLRRQGWDVNAQGLFGAPPFRVVMGAEAHSSVFKALALLGLGKERVELVPVDDQGRMRADLVPQLDSNTLLILQAGNVNSGSFDPLDELCERGRAAGAWVHIDGAFVMVDTDLALVNSTRLPYLFFDLLAEYKIRTVEVHYADESRVTNCLALRPGKVLLAINNGTGTAERLEKAGVEVVPLEYGECQHNGGGIHCSTFPLIRERS